MSFTSRYTSPPPLRSPLFRSLPDAVPPTDELEALQAELRTLKRLTLDRVRKAGDDMRLIKESMRRIEEREKGKQKAVGGIKKERAHTPMLLDTSPPPSAVRSRMSSTAGPSLSQRPSMDSIRSGHDNYKKKKRKRDQDDSDNEPEPQRIRKASPAPSTHSLSNSYLHPSKGQKIPTTVPPKAPTVNDWAVPASTSLTLPLRPPIPPPPPPGPSHPSEVMDDFSKWKQPNQVQVGTFYTSIEPWLRPIKEEDVGFLAFAGDEVGPFVLPPLGQHYGEVWEAEDIALYGEPLPGMPYGPAPTRERAPPTWEPSTLSDADVVEERRGQGILTERLMSALLPAPETTQWKGVKAAEEAMEGRPSGGAGAAAARDSMTVEDLEKRIRASVRALGVISEQTDPDSFEPLDDPVTTALRQAQRELRTVLATNKLRRQRLADIARDRLGYQEYLELRDSLDRNIAGMYTKLQKRDTPKPVQKESSSHHKKKKKPSSDHPNGAHPQPEGPPPPAPSALGLLTDAEHRVRAPEALEKLVQTRRQWVDTVGAVFEQKQAEHPGRIWGFPPTSVFEGIEDEVREMLANGSFGTDTSSKTGATAGASSGASASVTPAPRSIQSATNGTPVLRGWSMEGVESTEHG